MADNPRGTKPNGPDSLHFTSSRWIGLVAILAASTIYAANFVVSRYGIREAFSAYDLVLLRFLVAGLLLMPVVARGGFLRLGGIGWKRGLILTFLSGAPYILVFLSGFHFAPVSHGSALNPGSIPVVVAVLAWISTGARISAARWLAFATIGAGLLLVTEFGLSGVENEWAGDLLFFASGVSWGTFTFLVNRWAYPPLMVAAVVSVLSLLLLPIGLPFFGESISSAPLSHIIIQAVNQGVLNAIAGLYLFSVGVQKMGSRTASLFSPLIPVLATLLAIPFLNELPTPTQWFAMCLVVGGMFAAAKLAGKAV